MISGTNLITTIGYNNIAGSKAEGAEVLFVMLLVTTEESLTGITRASIELLVLLTSNDIP